VLFLSLGDNSEIYEEKKKLIVSFHLGKRKKLRTQASFVYVSQYKRNYVEDSYDPHSGDG
jgi:hypothetical protein